MEGKKQINNGLILVEPTPEDYVIGSNSPLVHDIKFINGHGIMDFIAKGEFQNKGFESMGCVSMSANHNTQIIKRVNFELDENESDRFTIVGSGTSERGNDLNSVAEFKRKKGYVLEEQYPWPDDISKDDFFSNIPKTVYDLATKNKSIWELKHEWLITRSTDIINVLATGCPVQATITQWEERDGINYSVSSDQIHAINIVDYEYGKYWWIYDQYNSEFVFDGNTDPKRFLKKFDWDFPFGTFGKKFTLKKNVNLLTSFKNMFNKIVRDVHGALWFVKQTEQNGTKFMGKQKIETALELAGALVDEVGCVTKTDAELSKCLEYKFFGN